MSKFYYIIIVIFFISCSYNKELEVKENFFETEEYYSKESFEKTLFLDSLKKLSFKLVNDSINRKFLFELSTQYYYLNNIPPGEYNSVLLKKQAENVTKFNK